ncbi:ATP-grasp ribosomal peptide maturase [Actinomadura atramentaria]|uniref:ATP-grasp ribosomal peptide maturase n=1 Tax=Actinomadura atramentaria TaxID=1990 RepID=UPI001F0A9DCF|nr:ATP-grasp ribosomal peptide maturase [Actinomadura atramentaria]
MTSLEDATADLVVSALNERAVPVARVDPADIGERLTFAARIDGSSWSGRLRTDSRDVPIESVTAVYYRRPTPFAARYAALPRLDREFAAAEARQGLGGVLADIHGARYVNHPFAVARAEYKPVQLRRFAELGLLIPPTLITNDVRKARAFAARNAPVIYKPFRGLPSIDGENAGAIWAQRVDAADFDDSIAVTAHLFQKEVPKTSDARVTVVGRRVFVQRITAPDAALDWRRGDWAELVHTPIAVPEPIERALHRYLADMALVFGCFDFALTGDGERAEDWTILECNPNGQWGWLPDADSIAEAFADVLTEKET